MVVRSRHVVVPLPGPESIGGVDYVPQSVEYCHGASPAGRLNQALIYQASNIISGLNSTDVDGAGGCRTIVLASVVANPELVLDDAAAGSVLQRITTTWVPASEFTPSAVDSLAASDLPGNG